MASNKRRSKLDDYPFGVAFDVLETKARTGRNPRTGEPLQIKGKKKPRFKASSELTDKVN